MAAFPTTLGQSSLVSDLAGCDGESARSVGYICCPGACKVIGLTPVDTCTSDDALRAEAERECAQRGTQLHDFVPTQKSNGCGAGTAKSASFACCP
jgi:hypothetical protein